MAGQKSPKRAAVEEFGSPSLDFCGAIFYAGLFVGHFAGLSPPRKKSRQRNRELRNAKFRCFLRAKHVSFSEIAIAQGFSLCKYPKSAQT